jgi:hypothetical protein
MSTTPVIVNRTGTVHNLHNANCAPIIKARVQAQSGRVAWKLVNLKQIKVYRLAGCNTCFGSTRAFDEYVNLT